MLAAVCVFRFPCAFMTAAYTVELRNALLPRLAGTLSSIVAASLRVYIRSVLERGLNASEV